jgi:predicted dehydrogenase
MELTALIARLERLNVAIIGCGAVAQMYYTPALTELEKLGLVRVKALYDPDSRGVAELRRSFPAAVPVPELAALAQHDIDLAIVASPPRFHAGQTIELLQMGVAVLCEKPMATALPDGEAMAASAAQTGQVLAIGFFRRFFPAIQAIQRILEQDMLGQIKTFHCYEGGPFHWPVQSTSFFQKSLAGGGVLMDLGVHLLDLLIWWWGYPTQITYEDDALGGVEANCRLQLEFAASFSGEVKLSRDWNYANRYVIEGTKGWLSWDVNEADNVNMGLTGSSFVLHSHLHHCGDYHQPAQSTGPAVNFQQSFIRQLLNVAAATQGLEPLAVNAEEGLLSLKLIDNCYRQRTLMPLPWLSEQEWQHAQEWGE